LPIGVERYKRKIKRANPRFNLVPFIDILFTLLIFFVVTGSFQGINEGTFSSSGKPEPGETLGPLRILSHPRLWLEKSYS